jgi:ABC-type glycerol-3-phosphate transport system permease component
MGRELRWPLFQGRLSTSFGDFLLRQFIQTQPPELIAAAKIDDRSESRLFSDIIVPLRAG